MSACKVKPSQAKGSKTKFANAQQRASLSSRLKTTLQIPDSHTAIEKQGCEERKQPREKCDDRVTSNNKHGKHQTPPKKKKLKKTTQTELCETKKTVEDQILPDLKKISNKRGPSQEPYAELYVSDDTDERELFSKRSYIVLKWRKQGRKMFVFFLGR